MKNFDFYISRGFTPEMAAYFSAGIRKILSVSPNTDFTLTLSFDNGEVRTYDCKPLLLPGTVFSPLMEYENFQRVYLDEDHCVSWDIDPAIDSQEVWSNKVNISPEECYVNSYPATENNSPCCENCKYLDDCPSEYQSESGGYCENWESI